MFAPENAASALPNPAEVHTLDPITLFAHATPVGKLVLLILVVASTVVWLVWILKSLQLGRLSGAQHAFERSAETVVRAEDLVSVALQHRSAPGGRVVLELAKRHDQRAPTPEFLMAVAKRAIATEQQKASALMPLLSSIASSSPFIGLFGTVWGIMDAFIRIGISKSASLPVVAPAIGEALIATAFGLVAAIPATIGYNFVDKRIGDLVEELTASAEGWVYVIAGRALTEDTPPQERGGFPAR
jgi:biopolymer transport protein TolQ